MEIGLVPDSDTIGTESDEEESNNEEAPSAGAQEAPVNAEATEAAATGIDAADAGGSAADEQEAAASAAASQLQKWWKACIARKSAADAECPTLEMMQMRLDAEDAANYALLRASVENEMKQPWSRAFPDLNNDPNAVDTFTVDERTDAIWALMKQHNSKDVTCNWDEITKHIVAARKQSKDEKEQDNTKEEDGTGSAAAVEKAAADGKGHAAGSQADGTAAPGAAAAEAAAEGEAEAAGRGDVQPAQDHNKAEREHRPPAPAAGAPEAVAADNRQLDDAALEPGGGEAAVPNPGTEGQADAAGRGDVQPAQDQKNAEREDSKQRCRTDALAQEKAA